MESCCLPVDRAEGLFDRLVAQDLVGELGARPAAQQTKAMQRVLRDSPLALGCSVFVLPVGAEREHIENERAG